MSLKKNLYQAEFNMRFQYEWFVLVDKHNLVRCFKYLFSLLKPDCCIILGKDHTAHDNNRIGENILSMETWLHFLSFREMSFFKPSLKDGTFDHNWQCLLESLNEYNRPLTQIQIHQYSKIFLDKFIQVPGNLQNYISTYVIVFLHINIQIFNLFNSSNSPCIRLLGLP